MDETEVAEAPNPVTQIMLRLGEAIDAELSFVSRSVSPWAARAINRAVRAAVRPLYEIPGVAEDVLRRLDAEAAALAERQAAANAAHDNPIPAESVNSTPDQGAGEPALASAEPAPIIESSGGDGAATTPDAVDQAASGGLIDTSPEPAEEPVAELSPGAAAILSEDAS